MSALSNYANNYKNPPVTTKIPGSKQVVNNTGGFVFEVSPKARLERFLILGTDGGTYYVSEKDLTRQNVDFIVDLIKTDGQLVLDTVYDVSKNGRSYRNSAAIFVLALVLVHGSDKDKEDASKMAVYVARTATMVFELAEFIDKLGGWGRAKRRAIANWFTSKTPDELAYQAVKYRQRNGWTLRDLMRLSHPVGVDQRVGNFILGKPYDGSGIIPGVIRGFEGVQKASSVSELLPMLTAYPSLPWETIPTQFLKEPEVWKTLFYNNQLNGQALVRNVKRLQNIGAFSDIKFAGDYANKLVDEEMIRKTRLHPVNYLLASLMSGVENTKIKTALNDGFYKSFSSVEPSGSRFRIGVDVSGSMGWGKCIGVDITPAQGAAAMALVTAKVEDYVEILGFANSLKNLGISPSDSFESVMRKTSLHNFGWTDPGLLIQDAANKKIEVDTFLVITDNEVNHGQHPSLALKNYRQKMGIDAKLVVMGMTATNFTLADPSDRGMLDVVGFDANAPKVVSDFAAGRF